MYSTNNDRADGIHHAATVLENHRDVAPADVTPHLRRIFQHAPEKMICFIRLVGGSPKTA